MGSQSWQYNGLPKRRCTNAITAILMWQLMQSENPWNLNEIDKFCYRVKATPRQRWISASLTFKLSKNIRLHIHTSKTQGDTQNTSSRCVITSKPLPSRGVLSPNIYISRDQIMIFELELDQHRVRKPYPARLQFATLHRSNKPICNGISRFMIISRDS